MIELWNSFIDNLQAILMVLTQALGGNLGLAIVVLSCSVRFALMPLTLRIAKRMQVRQRILKSLQPNLERLRVRYSKDPDRLTRETLKLYRANGVGFFDAKSMGGTLLQVPIMTGLYSAIRRGLGVERQFLWIRDLAQPDIVLGIVVGLLTLGMTALAPSLQPNTKLIMLLLPSIITLVIVSQMSSGIGLYWAASNIVGLVQSAILRRTSTKP